MKKRNLDGSVSIEGVNQPINIFKNVFPALSEGTHKLISFMVELMDNTYQLNEEDYTRRKNISISREYIGHKWYIKPCEISSHRACQISNVHNVASCH